MAGLSGSPIDNAGSDRDADIRRTGGSSNDPHGGHQHPDSEWHGPEPDPVEELVPAGSGELPATRRSIAEADDNLAYTGSQVPNLVDQLAGVDGMGTLDAQLAPGFGPGELDKPRFEGNPELGIDPNDVVPREPTGENDLGHEGVHETGRRK